MDYLDLLRITPWSPVDPLIHAESCPRGRDTECHAQSHVVHMHNRYVPAAMDGYPQYPQGLLTLLTPFFLFTQITSPLLPRTAKIGHITQIWVLVVEEFFTRAKHFFQLKNSYTTESLGSMRVLSVSAAYPFRGQRPSFGLLHRSFPADAQEMDVRERFDCRFQVRARLMDHRMPSADPLLRQNPHSRSRFGALENSDPDFVETPHLAVRS